MKKLLSTMLIAVLAIFMLGTVSKATTENELKEYMLGEQEISGVNLIVSDQDKPKIERFFNDYDVTDEQAGKIKKAIEKGIDLMTEEGATNPNELSTRADKEELLGYAREAAEVMGFTVRYNTTSSEPILEIWDGDKHIDNLHWPVISDVEYDGEDEAVTEESTSVEKSSKANSGKKQVSTEKGILSVSTGSTNYVYAIAAGVVLIAGITLVVARKNGKNVIK